MAGRQLRFLAAVAFLFWTVTAFGNTLGVNDGQQLHSLRVKLHSVNVDITQVMDQIGVQNPAVVDCLDLIHNQADSAGETAAAINSLVGLAALMRDHTDEVLVLHELKI
jgi:hypothetical protein